MRPSIIPLPNQRTITNTLDYNQETGLFIRKPRPIISPYDKSVNTKYAGKEAGKVDGHGYRIILVDGQLYYAHRLAWMIVYNEDPGEKYIDHINGNTSDNRIINLRLVTPSNNNLNTRKQKTHKTRKPSSLHKGVSSYKDRWKSRIIKEGVSYYLGVFNSETEAAHAYNVKALELNGQYAKLNVLNAPFVRGSRIKE